MIDPEKLNSEELADVVFEVQSRTGYRFDLNEVFEIARNTIRKADLNRKDESYVPILLKNELEESTSWGGLTNVPDMQTQPMLERLSKCSRPAGCHHVPKVRGTHHSGL